MTLIVFGRFHPFMFRMGALTWMAVFALVLIEIMVSVANGDQSAQLSLDLPGLCVDVFGTEHSLNGPRKVLQHHIHRDWRTRMLDELGPLRPVTTENPLTYELYLYLLRQVEQIARIAHAGQYYDQDRHMEHVEHVQKTVRLLLFFGWDPKESVIARYLVIGLWAHDTIEDTEKTLKITRADLEMIFGWYIAALDDALTKPPRRPGLSDEARTRQGIRKINKHPLGPTAKIYDLFYNMVYGLLHEGTPRLKYKANYKFIRKQIGPGSPHYIDCPQNNRVIKALDQLVE